MGFDGDLSNAFNEFLTVRLAGGAGRLERFMLVGRPHDGLVHVRQWSTNTLNTAGDDFDVDQSELLADIETHFGAGFGVTPDMYEIRLWLGG